MTSRVAQLIRTENPGLENKKIIKKYLKRKKLYFIKVQFFSVEKFSIEIFRKFPISQFSIFIQIQMKNFRKFSKKSRVFEKI